MLITCLVHFAKIEQNCEIKPITAPLFVKKLTIQRQNYPEFQKQLA